MPCSAESISLASGTGRDRPDELESGETTRERLIQSAERLFAARGFDGVSVRDIANDAKVNSAMVGYYFEARRDCSPSYTRDTVLP